MTPGPVDWWRDTELNPHPRSEPMSNAASDSLLLGRIQTPQPLRRCEGGPSRVAGMLHPSRDVTLPVQHTPDIDMV
jgi:hypothetical protein